MRPSLERQRRDHRGLRSAAARRFGTSLGQSPGPRVAGSVVPNREPEPRDPVRTSALAVPRWARAFDLLLVAVLEVQPVATRDAEFADPPTEGSTPASADRARRWSARPWVGRLARTRRPSRGTTPRKQ